MSFSIVDTDTVKIKGRGRVTCLYFTRTYKIGKPVLVSSTGKESVSNWATFPLVNVYKK